MQLLYFWPDIPGTINFTFSLQKNLILQGIYGFCQAMLILKPQLQTSYCIYNERFFLRDRAKSGLYWRPV